VDVTVLSSSVEGAAHQFAASYVVNGSLVIDAGSIGFSSLERQKSVRSILISHAHLDHVTSLPIFIDNVYQPGPDCPTVYASQHVVDNLMAHFFNDTVWPDVIRLSREESPFIRFVILEDGKPVQIDGITVTPIPLNHVIPTFGFIVDDGTTAVAFISDTAQTDAIWEYVRNSPRVKAVFLEAAFPNSMAWLAEKAKHLTPSVFLEEYSKAGRSLPVLAVHIKPAFYSAVVSELKQLNLDKLTISQPNQTYTF
jgi:cAMP phosphodiesterase